MIEKKAKPGIIQSGLVKKLFIPASKATAAVRGIAKNGPIVKLTWIVK